MSFIPRGRDAGGGVRRAVTSARRTPTATRTFEPKEANYYLVVAHHEDADEKGEGYDVDEVLGDDGRLRARGLPVLRLKAEASAEPFCDTGFQVRVHGLEAHAAVSTAFQPRRACATFADMAKAKRPTEPRLRRRQEASRRRAGPVVATDARAVEGHARMAGVSSVQYIRGVMTGRYPRLSPRELGEE